MFGRIKRVENAVDRSIQSLYRKRERLEEEVQELRAKIDEVDGVIKKLKKTGFNKGGERDISVPEVQGLQESYSDLISTYNSSLMELKTLNTQLEAVA